MPHRPPHQKEDSSKPQCIGVAHLLPLPGAPRYAGDFQAIQRRALEDVTALVAAGFHGVVLENFGDAPFYPGAVPQHVVAQMSAIATAIRHEHDIALGLNVLRNDGCAAMAIAQAVGAEFIRVNVLCGSRLTDQGIIHGIAHDLLRLRRSLGADHIRIFADVNVKHSAPLASIPIEQEVEDLVHRGGADALIVTGSGTGKATAIDELIKVKAAAGRVPVLIGSGITAESISKYAVHADGFIVGSSLKIDGLAMNPIDAKYAAELMRRVHTL